MAEYTAQKLETLTVIKLTTEILITYSETTFGWPTLGYVMTENWINGCCGLNKEVTDSLLGHTENGHKKQCP